MQCLFCSIASICTAIVGLKILRGLFYLFYETVISKVLNVKKLEWKSLGKWAVITGSTDGIGKAYSAALAKKGFNVVLISRTQSKLDAVAEEIRGNYKVETKTISADFTKDSIYDEIEKQLEGLEIGVLVNNVGMSYDHPQYFLELPNDSDSIKNLINCNLLSVMNMCKIVMPGMVQRKRGVVINISSASSLIPSPLLAVYASTKAAVTKFSSDLAYEYKKHGLIIQGVCPGFVATNMSKIRKTTWGAPSPKTFVDSALETVGHSVVTTGYLPHTLLNCFIYTLDFICRQLSAYVVFSSMQKSRKKALRKAGKTH